MAVSGGAFRGLLPLQSLVAFIRFLDRIGSAPGSRSGAAARCLLPAAAMDEVEEFAMRNHIDQKATKAHIAKNQDLSQIRLSFVFLCVGRTNAAYVRRCCDR